MDLFLDFEFPILGTKSLTPLAVFSARASLDSQSLIVIVIALVPSSEEQM